MEGKITEEDLSTTREFDECVDLLHTHTCTGEHNYPGQTCLYLAEDNEDCYQEWRQKLTTLLSDNNLTLKDFKESIVSAYKYVSYGDLAYLARDKKGKFQVVKRVIDALLTNLESSPSPLPQSPANAPITQDALIFQSEESDAGVCLADGMPLHDAGSQE